MKPEIVTPHKDIDSWVESFPILNEIRNQLLDDMQRKDINYDYYIGQLPNNTYGSIMRPRLEVLIWMETGVIPQRTADIPEDWASGEHVLNGQTGKVGLILIGAKQNVPAALIYVEQDKSLIWQVPSENSGWTKIS